MHQANDSANPQQTPVPTMQRRVAASAVAVCVALVGACTAASDGSAIEGTTQSMGSSSGSELVSTGGTPLTSTTSTSFATQTSGPSASASSGSDSTASGSSDDGGSESGTADTDKPPSTQVPAGLLIIRLGHGLLAQGWATGSEGDALGGAPILNALAPFSDQVLVVEGIDAIPTTGLQSLSHTAGAPSLLTGGHVSLEDESACCYGALGASIDHHIGAQSEDAFPLESVNLAVLPNPSDVCPEFGCGSYATQYVFDAQGSPTPIQDDAHAVASMLMTHLSEVTRPSDGQQAALTALEHVDELLSPPYANTANHREATSRAMLTLSYAALAGQMTRASTVSLLDPVVFTPVGPTTESYHQLGHQSSFDDGAAMQLLVAQAHVFQQVAELVERFAATPASDGSLLDHVAIVVISELRDPGTHATLDVPVIIIGNLGGTLASGRVVVDGNTADLWHTLGGVLGVNMEGFGSPQYAPATLTALLGPA